MKTKLILALCLSSCLGFTQNIYPVASLVCGSTEKDASGNLYVSTSGYKVVKIAGATNITTTVAGTGTQGYNGDGFAATSANLDNPTYVAVDGSGNVYITDNVSHRIRKVTASTGIITTVAGNGTAGSGGDGGAATSANLNYPNGIALDGSGNIYISDRGNQKIRKVTISTGNISTVAGNGTAGSGGDGGAATSANLNYPNNIEVDGSGNIYIADGGNHKIRKVTISTGNISTVAGNGTAGSGGDGAAATSANLDTPLDVAVDGSNNLYIVDNFNHKIRKVTAATGNISTIVGTGVSGTNGDGGAATSAQLNYPVALFIDGAGRIYIADNGNSRIRAVGTQCPANAGVDKTTSANPCCSCSGLQIGTASTGYTYNWGVCDATLSSCTAAQTFASPCNTIRNYTLTVSGSACISKSDVVKVTTGAGCCRMFFSSESAEMVTGIKIFPNPSDGKIIIETEAEMQSVIITDMTGRIVYNENNFSSHSVSLDISKEAKGMYLMKITQNGIDRIEKITIE